MPTLRHTPVALALLTLLAGCSGAKDDGSGGKSRTFWSWDLSVMPPSDKRVEATMRAETEHAYIYVENALWEDEVDDLMLAELVNFLEDSTPGSPNPSQGIVENDIATFGPIPDALDDDPKFYLLLMNIEPFEDNQFDGFFRAIDQEPDGSDPDYRSNEVEMLYVNAEIRPVDSDTTLSVIAHELVHLIEWGQDPNEDGWLSETFGELGMTINGFYTDDEWVEDFQAHPEESLFGGQFSVHYGACLLFGNYLYERFGEAFVSDLAASTADGTESIDAVLAAAGGSETFESVYLDWVAANALDATGDYGYEFADIPAVTFARTVTTTAMGAAALTVDPLATRYVRIDVPGPVTLNVIHGASAPAGARVVSMRYASADPANIFEVSVKDPATPSFSVAIDATYDEAIVALIAYSQAQTFSIDVQAE